jgi:streptomycin 6-kinase
VRLLKADPARGCVLLERLKPGTPLSAVADDDRATQIVAQVMGKLWRLPPADHSFRSVADWAAGLGRLRKKFGGGTGPLSAVLVTKAERLFTDLLASMKDEVLLHGDLHHENILYSERRGWMAIDPKGILCEPAYEVGALLRNISPHLLSQPRPAQVVARRVNIVCEELGLDPKRVLAWGLAQAVLSAWWCLEDGAGCEAQAMQAACLIETAMEGM